MRSTLLFLLFSAGSAASFGQAGPLTTEQSQQAPSPWNAPGTQLQGRDFSQWPLWDPTLNSQSRTMLLPPQAGAGARLGDANLDPKFIRRPSARDLGVQPPGTQVAQNLFPGLVFQPIDGGRCGPPAAGPLATTWPRLKVERIPTEWPGLKMGPAARNSAPVTGVPGR